MDENRIYKQTYEDGYVRYILPSKLQPKKTLRFIVWSIAALAVSFFIITTYYYFFLNIALIGGYWLMEGVIVIVGSALFVFLFENDARIDLCFFEERFFISKRILWIRFTTALIKTKDVISFEYAEVDQELKEKLQYIDYVKYKDAGFYKPERNASKNELLAYLSNEKKYVVFEYLKDEEKHWLCDELNETLQNMKETVSSDSQK